MGDHFVLLVDRLLTESTLEAAIENRKVSQNGCASASASASAVEVGAEFSLQKSNFSDVSLLPRKLVECRICHDEDEDSNMETPCSCCGSLKVGYGYHFVILFTSFLLNLIISQVMVCLWSLVLFYSFI